MGSSEFEQTKVSPVLKQLSHFFGSYYLIFWCNYLIDPTPLVEELEVLLLYDFRFWSVVFLDDSLMKVSVHYKRTGMTWLFLLQAHLHVDCAQPPAITWQRKFDDEGKKVAMLSMTTDIFTIVSKHVNMDCTFLNFAFRTKNAYYLCCI